MTTGGCEYCKLDLKTSWTHPGERMQNRKKARIFPPFLNMKTHRNSLKLTCASSRTSFKVSMRDALYSFMAYRPMKWFAGRVVHVVGGTGMCSEPFPVCKHACIAPNSHQVSVVSPYHNIQGKVIIIVTILQARQRRVRTL